MLNVCDRHDECFAQIKEKLTDIQDTLKILSEQIMQSKEKDILHNEKIKSSKEDIMYIKKKIEYLEKEIVSLKIKAATVSGMISFAVSLLFFLLKKI